MMHEARWQIEREVMNQHFPSFAAVNTNRTLGFYGYLRGPRTGRLYLVSVLSPAARYPELEPPVYIEPRVGPHWNPDGVNHDPRGRLDYVRDKPWNPRINTFANCVLCAIAYLKEYDQ